MFVILHVMCGYWREQRQDFVGLVVIGKQVPTKSCKILVGFQIFSGTSWIWLENKLLQRVAKFWLVFPSSGDQLNLIGKQNLWLIFSFREPVGWEPVEWEKSSVEHSRSKKVTSWMGKKESLSKMSQDVGWVRSQVRIW